MINRREFLVLTTFNIFLPHLISPNKCDKLNQLIIENHSNHNLLYDKRLELAGNNHIVNMIRYDFFSHYDPFNNTWSNQRITLAGFPNDYPPNSNQVESLKGGCNTADKVYNAWLNSPSHRKHILGLGNFSNHTHYATAYVNDINSRYENYWTFISARIKE